MLRRRLFALAAILALAPLPGLAECGEHCGTERWTIKALTDDWVKFVDFTPVPRSINWLRTRTRPHSLPGSHRLIGIETMTFTVRGVVLYYKLEDDRDFHVVIAQSNNHARTMIVEFANPACSEICSSEHLDEIRKARDDFVAAFGEPTDDWTELDDPVKVEVTGVGFFDRMHNQRGRALPSGVEIHPVLELKKLE